MAFEALSHRHVLEATDFPQRWLPLIFLYDPDLPLFPISYFHILPEDTGPDSRPGYSDRAFGYIEKVNATDDQLEIHIICNKDLDHHQNQGYLTPVTEAVYGRLGLSDPVKLADVASGFTGPMSSANPVLVEIWHRVVTTSYGNRLPFGKLWDPVLGLARYVASWNSSGRKGELIQTHYFTLRFGEPIQSAGGIPQTDFHLLPTFEELIDESNPLDLFPSYRSLCRASDCFGKQYFSRFSLDGLTLSRFNKPGKGQRTHQGVTCSPCSPMISTISMISSCLWDNQEKPEQAWLLTDLSEPYSSILDTPSANRKPSMGNPISYSPANPTSERTQQTALSSR